MCVLFCTLSHADFGSDRHNPRQYTTLLGQSVAPTPLWGVDEQSIRVTIDNTSVFTPGTAAPQLGFRRTELITQGNPISNRTAFDETIETGVTAFHFSLQADPQRPLNLTHDYQVAFIEPSDGTHVFGLELGASDLLPKFLPPSWQRTQSEIRARGLPLIRHPVQPDP